MAQRRDIAPDALALFAVLENTRRRDRAYQDKSYELAKLLNLGPEWWTRNSVLDRSCKPLHQPPYIAHDDWNRCRAVRLALLGALR